MIRTLIFIALWMGLVGGPLFSVATHFNEIHRLWDPAILSLAGKTAACAAVSALGAGIFGLALGLGLGSLWTQNARVTRALRWILGVPFGIPTLVVATTWIFWLKPTGLLYSYTGLILAQIFLNAPWIALQVAEFRAQVDPAEIDAARVLGGGAVQRFLEILWPRVRRAWVSVAGQVFVFCATGFTLVMILGGGPPLETLEVAIFAKMKSGEMDLQGALAAAVWSVALSSGVTFGLRFLMRGRDRGRTESLREIQSTGSDRRWTRIEKLSIGVAALSLVPYLALLSSLGSLPLSPELGASILISLQIALQVSIGVVGVSLLTLWVLRGMSPGARSAIDFVLASQSGVSTLFWGLGFFLFYRSAFDPFVGSRWLLVALQVALYWPMGVRTLAPLLNQRSVLEREAALVLGATPFRIFWWLEWPRWRGPVAALLAMSIGVSLGEFAAVSFFARPGDEPLPLMISRALGSYRVEEGFALAALLFGLSLAAQALTVGLGGSRRVA